MPGLPNSNHGCEDQMRNISFKNASFLFALRYVSENTLSQQILPYVLDI